MDCDRLEHLNTELRTAQCCLRDIEEGRAKIYIKGRHENMWWIEAPATKKAICALEKDRLETLCADLKRQICELVNAPAEDAGGKE